MDYYYNYYYNMNYYYNYNYYYYYYYYNYYYYWQCQTSECSVTIKTNNWAKTMR